MEWQEEDPSAGTLGKVVAATWSFYIVDYFMREFRWKLHAQSYNVEWEWVAESEYSLFLKCFGDFCCLDYIMRETGWNYTYSARVFTQVLACKKMSKSRMKTGLDYTAAWAMDTKGMNLEVMIEKMEKSLPIVGSYTDLFLKSSEFRHPDYILQQNNDK